MPSIPFRKGHDLSGLDAALASGQQTDFNAVQRYGTAKLVSPQAAYQAPEQALIPPPPADDSLQAAAELIEIGAASLFRDVPFSEIRPGVGQVPMVIRTLRTYGAAFQGPTRPDALFRYSTAPAHLAGPYVSQLLLTPVSINASLVHQRILQRTGSYGGTATTWAQLQQGNIPEPQQFGSDRLIATPRDLASAVHQDPPFLLGLNAALILASSAGPSTRFPVLPNEAGFVSYGGAANLHCAVAEVTRLALQAAWRVKWLMHRQRRPEELWPDRASLHSCFITLGQPVIQAVGDYLPLVYAEGAPLHPSYPSGHAAISGAIATILKAWFSDAPWPRQIVHSVDGNSLVPWVDPPNAAAPLPLQPTIHGEIDKWAANCGWGRNFAGIHTRSDCRYGMDLGEHIAIQWLGNARVASHEALGPVQFRRFNGQQVLI